MISNRPYMIRAMYDWIVDNGWTPHVQVDANYPSVNVPQAHVQDGVIVLNMAPTAVVALAMDNDWFTFKARFGGIENTLGFPPEAILAIFARENGQGMPFPPEPYPDELLPGREDLFDEPTSLSAVPASKASSSDEGAKTKTTVSKAKKSSDKKPTLTIVK